MGTGKCIAVYFIGLPEILFAWMMILLAFDAIALLRLSPVSGMQIRLLVYLFSFAQFRFPF